ncbi:MAG: hypothetical protein NVS9B3_14540 [Gemmatimonadaceae bacterium]
MRHPFRVSLLVAGILAGRAPLGAQSSETEIRRLEQEWALASLHGDTAAFNRLMAPDFRLVLTDGSIEHRAGRLRAFGSGTVRTTALDLSDVRVYVNGDISVVTGLATRKDTAGSHARDFQYRYTRVWQRRAGHWQVKDFQTTTLAPGHMGGVRRPGGGVAGTGGQMQEPPGAISRATAEQQVLALARENQDASRRNDADALERIYAQDYFFTDSRGGTADRRRQLEAVRSGAVVFDTLAVSDERVRVYGDAAVVTFRRRQVAHVSGDPRPRDVRVTDVFARLDGRWQLVAAQVTAIRE